MRTEQIHYLKVINQYSSINTAAKMLNISPQALSLSMNSLEEELGFVILNRTRFGSFLTSQGTELLTHGQKFLDAVENMKQNRSIKHPALTHATLHLMATNGAIETNFSTAIGQLYTEYPNIKLQIERTKYSDIIAHLVDKSSLGIIYHLSVNGIDITDLSKTPYEFIPFLTGKYYCVTTDKFPVYNYKSVSVKTMLSYPNILYAPTMDVMKALYRQINPNEKNLIVVDDYAIYKQMILSGIGIGMLFVPDKYAPPSSNQFKVIPLKEKVVSSLGCIKVKYRSLLSEQQDFINYMCDYYQNSFSHSESALI